MTTIANCNLLIQAQLMQATLAGSGIKAPSISQELSSLFTLQQTSGSQAVVAGLAPIGPERNRSFDVGVEQGLWGGRARVRASDNARDWTEGEGSFIDADETALLRSDPEVGEVAVHFPRLGYDWRRAR